MADIDDARAWQAYLLHNADALERALRKPNPNTADPTLYDKSVPKPQIVRGVTNSINSLVSTVIAKQQKDFSNLPDGFLQHLAPYIKVFTIYFGIIWKRRLFLF